MSDTALSFGARLSLAIKVLFDGIFAARLSAGALPAATALAAETPPKPEQKTAPAPTPEPQPPDSRGGALHLLAILQREGRLVDFLQEDLGEFSDAEVGAAARVVHAGCKKALDQHFSFGPLRDENEGSKITLQPGFDASQVRLTGNVQGDPPYSGTMVHGGWRVVDVRLPTRGADVDPALLAPAEVEL